MLERFLITMLIAITTVGLYWLFTQYHRRYATATNQVDLEHTYSRILYFRSNTCAACATQTRYLDQIGETLCVPLEKIDVDQNPELAQQYGVLTLPTTLIVDDEGQVRHINYGVTNPVKLTRQLQKVC